MSNTNDTFVTAANTSIKTDFLDSLDTMTVSDVVPPHRKRPKISDFSVSKLYRFIIVLLCMAVFVYCVYELIGISNDYESGDALYNDINDKIISILLGSTQGNVSQMQITASDTPMRNNADVLQFGTPIYTPPAGNYGPGKINPEYQKMLVALESLRDINSDIVGHISIADTKIQYPVVHCDNNDYYLKHMYDKTPNSLGAIFIDFRNRPKIEENKNIIFYGHNMISGSMFGEVPKFLDEDFFMNTAHDIRIGTFDGIYTFRVFSIYPTNKYDNYFQTNFLSDEEFVNFCQYRESKSLFHREDISFTEDDIIITLSTCLLGQQEGRYALHAKLINVIK